MIPVVPGGAATALKVARAGDKVVDTVKAVSKTADTGVVKKAASHFDCSFDAETLVRTDAGPIFISDIDIGDQVWAYHEFLGTSGFYPVTALWVNEDPVTVYLTIDGELIKTTPDHPFLTISGEWVAAGDLSIGSQIISADGATGAVDAIEFVASSELMYNLTVAEAHTYVVGGGQWIVHNVCNPFRKLKKNLAPGEQANHLNQDAAFRDFIPRNDGMSNPLSGNAFTDIGSPHYNFHESLEQFWDQFRRGGSKENLVPTIGEYSQALEQALKAAGASADEIEELVRAARKNRMNHGLADGDLIPRVPHKLNQRKR